VLRSGDEFRAWCAAAGISSATEARRSDAPTEERRLLRDAGRFRAALRSTVESLAEGLPPDSAALTTVHAAWAEAMTHATASVDGEGVSLTWDPDQPRAALRELAWASLDLLSTAPIARLKLCPACGFAFLDTTKNRTRRWCSMADCGSQEKARRYVAKRAAKPSPPRAERPRR
jgi:predicted RNA-binding Zn ribbon-like protein